MPKEDAIKVRPDGLVELTLGGKTVTLRRPKIGEQWRFDEAFVSVQEAEREDVEWALSILGEDVMGEDAKPSAAAVLRAVRGSDPVESMKRTRARQEKLLDWWLLVIETLAPDDFAVPPIEDLPPFFLAYSEVARVRDAWASNPAVPGDD